MTGWMYFINVESIVLEENTELNFIKNKFQFY